MNRRALSGIAAAALLVALGVTQGPMVTGVVDVIHLAVFGGLAVLGVTAATHSERPVRALARHVSLNGGPPARISTTQVAHWRRAVWYAGAIAAFLGCYAAVHSLHADAQSGATVGLTTIAKGVTDSILPLLYALCVDLFVLVPLKSQKFPTEQDAPEAKVDPSRDQLRSSGQQAHA